MQQHPVVSHDTWLAQRQLLLTLEKQATHLRDRINAERQALPWELVEKDYVFGTQSGPQPLSQLFDGRSQLIVYHFMLAPGWQAGCKGCSFLADHLDGALPHLEHHDVTLTAISRAPLAEIAAYQRRMGWHFPWASSYGNDFNADYGVSFTGEASATGKVTYNYTEMDASSPETEMPGLSAFFQNEAREVFHTYSGYARGLEELIGTLMILDRAPLGRNERATMDFVRRHDEYADTPQARRIS